MVKKLHYYLFIIKLLLLQVDKYSGMGNPKELFVVYNRLCFFKLYYQTEASIDVGLLY